MKAEIAEFERAHEILQAAEQALNKKVSIALGECKTVADCMDLVNKLPKGYKGRRNCYQLAEEIDRRG